MKTKTPAAESDFKQRLRTHIMGGGIPKHFSLDAGMHRDTASKMLGAMGIRKVFITEDEHTHLVARRGGVA